MRILKELSRKEFIKILGTKEQCMKYLSKKKWKAGYSCRSCECSVFIKGKQLESRRCKRCGYDESPTAHTIFHKLKFRLDKAFEMMYDIATSNKGSNSIWLAERYDVAQNTAWLFRQKVQIAMQSSKKYPLENEVHLDEFEIGTPQKGEQGRSHSEKKIRVVYEGQFNYEVSTLLGQIVASGSAVDQEQLSMKDLADGAYIIKVIAGN